MGSYSFSLTTFSPTGKLMQIEYALNAVSKGKTSLGIRATNGVVLATEKKLPTPLIEQDYFEKLQNLVSHVGVVYSGMGPDFRVIVKQGRKRAQEYFRQYQDPMPTSQLVKETAYTMQEYTQSGGVRPFGVSILMAGYDDTDGPQLFQVDPSGAYFGWKATAIGKNFVNAKTFLEKRYVCVVIIIIIVASFVCAALLASLVICVLCVSSSYNFINSRILSSYIYQNI